MHRPNGVRSGRNPSLYTTLFKQVLCFSRPQTLPFVGLGCLASDCERLCSLRLWCGIDFDRPHRMARLSGRGTRPRTGAMPSLPTRPDEDDRDVASTDDPSNPRASPDGAVVTKICFVAAASFQQALHDQTCRSNKQVPLPVYRHHRNPSLFYRPTLANPLARTSRHSFLTKSTGRSHVQRTGQTLSRPKQST